MFIRKKLDPAELDPPGQRYDPTTGEFQRTNDGGATWINDPGIDPRVNPSGQLPPDSPSDTTRCNAAHRMRLAWQDALVQLNGTVSASEFALLMLGILLALAGGAGLLADILLAGFDAAVTIGISDINAAFVDALWDEIECDFYCNIAQDGSISANQLANVIAKIAADHPGDTVINGAVSIFNSFYGSVLLSNAAVERTETGDCSGCAACGWDVCIDLGWAWGSGSYVPSPSYNCGQPAFNYAPGQGVLDTVAGLPAWKCTKTLGDVANRLGRSFALPTPAGCVVTEVFWTYGAYLSGSPTSPSNLVFYSYLPQLPASDCIDAFYSFPRPLLVATPPADALTIWSAVGTSQPSDSRDVYVLQIRVTGTGVPPDVPTVPQNY